MEGRGVGTLRERGQGRRQGRDRSSGEGWNIGYDGGQGAVQGDSAEDTVERRTTRDQVQGHDKIR